MLGNVEVPALVVGIVQVIKLLFPELSTRAKLIIALVVGLTLLSLSEALPLLAPGPQAGLLAAVRVLGYAIAIPGWFGIAKDEVIERFAPFVKTTLEE